MNELILKLIRKGHFCVLEVFYVQKVTKMCYHWFRTDLTNVDEIDQRQN